MGISSCRLTASFAFLLSRSFIKECTVLTRNKHAHNISHISSIVKGLIRAILIHHMCNIQVTNIKKCDQEHYTHTASSISCYWYIGHTSLIQCGQRDLISGHASAKSRLQCLLNMQLSYICQKQICLAHCNDMLYLSEPTRWICVRT